MRSCDMHAIKRQDDIYLRNGQEEDYFFRRRIYFAAAKCIS